jgi:hypothetical protein
MHGRPCIVQTPAKCDATRMQLKREDKTVAVFWGIFQKDVILMQMWYNTLLNID